MDYLSKGKLANPKLTLYAFQLKHKLAQEPKINVKNADHLWLKCQQIGQQLSIPKLEILPPLIEKATKEKTDIIGEILPERILTFTAIEHKNNLHLRGEVNPLQINDTYALDLTLGFPKSKVKITDLKRLNKDNCLLPDNINASLGQTLVFFAKPLEKFENEESLHSFADACVKALISEEKFQELQVYRQDKWNLLGSPIFEYNNKAYSPQQQCHILIWLNINPQTAKLEESGEYYYPLINLLLCRSRIIYARHQAMHYNQQAREEYSELESKINEFSGIPNQDLNSCFDKFQKWLKSTPDKSFKYARYITYLQLHRTTIRTDIRNYKLYIDKINKLYSGDDLQFLSLFLKLTYNTYIQQITTDLEYLIPGQKLFENMIETIRGIVEIEEVKRDRSLERTVQVVATALGGGAIVSGVVAEHIKEPINPPNSKYPLHPITTSLIWSFIATIIFYIVARLWWRK